MRVERGTSGALEALHQGAEAPFRARARLSSAEGGRAGAELSRPLHEGAARAPALQVGAPTCVGRGIGRQSTVFAEKPQDHRGLRGFGLTTNDEMARVRRPRRLFAAGGSVSEN